MQPSLGPGPGGAKDVMTFTLETLNDFSRSGPPAHGGDRRGRKRPPGASHFTAQHKALVNRRDVGADSDSDSSSGFFTNPPSKVPRASTNHRTPSNVPCSDGLPPAASSFRNTVTGKAKVSTQGRKGTRDAIAPESETCLLCQCSPTVEQEKGLYSALALHELAYYGSVSDSVLFQKMADAYNDTMDKVARVKGIDALAFGSDSGGGTDAPAVQKAPRLTVEMLRRHYNGTPDAEPHVIVPRRQLQHLVNKWFQRLCHLTNDDGLFEMVEIESEEAPGGSRCVPVTDAVREQRVNQTLTQYMKLVKAASDVRFGDAAFVGKRVHPTVPTAAFGGEGGKAALRPDELSATLAASGTKELGEISTGLYALQRPTADMF